MNKISGVYKITNNVTGDFYMRFIRKPRRDTFNNCASITAKPSHSVHYVLGFAELVFHTLVLKQRNI